ncbi:MAG TPA: hypothetical protein VFW07_05440 [Parafilimonas sp.]|nr:hypothetical protein [Parafilimonas sp.]
MMKTSVEKNVCYTLRIASAMCFIGHGAFGIITKEIWCNYFGVFGIGRDMAYAFMPYVGTMDIIMGLIILFYPVRIVFGWLILWGTFTALLRPLSGEPFAEFIERAGNYGAPLALLLLTYSARSTWLKTISLKQVQFNTMITRRVTICLRIVVFLLFLGHGWLNLIEKKPLLEQYSSLGFSNPEVVAHIIGSLEILAGAITLIKPIHSILLIFFIWKMASELFYPHWEIFEFIERGGSYGSILALWFLTKPSIKIYLDNKQKHTIASALL